MEYLEKSSTAHHAFASASTSDLPPLAQVKQTLGNKPCLILAWKGDSSHPEDMVSVLVEAFPAAETNVAENLTEIRQWPEVVKDFLERISNE